MPFAAYAKKPDKMLVLTELSTNQELSIMFESPGFLFHEYICWVTQNFRTIPHIAYNNIG